MQPRVTAILVARNGASHLERTLEALRSQTRQPDTVITVDCGSTDATGELLSQFGPTHYLSADSDLTFGQAINAAVRLTQQPANDHEMLWLLAQDSAPEPGALAALLGELEIAPSVAVAGAKVMEWDAGDYIHQFGQSITPLGATVTLVENELDQAQHDGLSDVLAVSTGGMLVRHSVWEHLNGFDPGLPVVDDSLDFCIRVRLAGHRVSVVAPARVASAGDGVAGPDESSRGRSRRKRQRATRSAQLHRRLVYAPGWAVPLHWLTLVPLAIMRSIGQLLRKEPGAILGEFAAAFSAAFNGLRVSTARKQFAATRTLGWTSIASLRVPSAEVRRRHALKREASVTGLRGSRPEIRFFTGGGAWTVLAAAVAGVAILAPLLGASTLTGGGLVPLDNTPGELWRSVAYGWRDIGLGFVGAADPFAFVVAILGTLTFWAPSFALVLLYFLAFPLAAFGAWMAATRLTDRGGLRAIAAVLWVLAPTFLSAIAAGRPAAILVHLLLPWLFFAGYAAARSWSASASAALLFAALVACAPSLAPALLVGWIVCVVVSGRSVMRFIAIPLPALVLAAPLIWNQALRGNWLALFADPGAPVAHTSVSVWQLLLGFPSGGLGGWGPIMADLGLPNLTAQIMIPALLAPLAVISLVALFLPGSRTATFSLLAALLGFATAVAANLLQVASIGETPVSVWSGAGLSLYWLGIIGAVIVCLRRATYAMVPAVAAALTLLVAAAPLAAALPLGTSVVAVGAERTLPAFVTAEAQTTPRVGTLQIVPQPDGGVLATVVRGAQVSLNDQSTLASTSQELSDREEELAVLAGNLASRSGLDATAGLAEFGIRFVLLRPPAVAAALPGSTSSVTQEATSTLRRTGVALDGNAALVSIGETDFGQLWRFDAADDSAANGAIPKNAGAPIGLIALIIAAVVIGATILLSIPTGAGREAVRQAHRDSIRQTARANAKKKKQDRRAALVKSGAAVGAGGERRPEPGPTPPVPDDPEDRPAVPAGSEGTGDTGEVTPLVDPVEGTEVPATEDPDTEDPDTEVPETKDPDTEVPATEVPATEDPESEDLDNLDQRGVGSDPLPDPVEAETETEPVEPVETEPVEPVERRPEPGPTPPVPDDPEDQPAVTVESEGPTPDAPAPTTPTPKHPTKEDDDAK